jgi:hypothetical protein
MPPGAIETSQKKRYEKLIREAMRLARSRDPQDVFRVLSDRSGKLDSGRLDSRELERILLSKTARYHMARIMSSDSCRLAKLEKGTSKKGGKKFRKLRKTHRRKQKRRRMTHRR